MALSSSILTSASASCMPAAVPTVIASARPLVNAPAATTAAAVVSANSNFRIVHLLLRPARLANRRFPRPPRQLTLFCWTQFPANHGVPDQSAVLSPHSDAALGSSAGERASLRQRYRRSLLCALVATLAADARAQDIASATCKLDLIGTAALREVIDGRTATLADGHLIRLAGVETPADGPAAAEARVALTRLVSGREVMLRRLGAGQDRHGRLQVHVFVAGEERSVQRMLVAQGHARVAAHIGDAACAAELLKAEQTARAARLG